MAELGAITGEVGAAGSGLFCRECAYDLRGLSVDSRCPECGTPIYLSASRGQLQFSPPRWIARQRLGVLLTMLGSGAFVAVFALVLIAVITVLTRGVVTQMTITIGSLLPIVPPAGLMLTGVGWWLCDAPDPSLLDAARTRRNRIALQLLGPPLLIMGAVWFIDLSCGLPDALEETSRVLAITAVAAFFVGTFNQLRLIENLAKRMSDRMLTGVARIVAIGFIFAGAMIGCVWVADYRWEDAWIPLFALGVFGCCHVVFLLRVICRLNWHLALARKMSSIGT